MSTFSDNSHCRFWIKASGDGTTNRGSFNVTGITDEGTGDLTVTIATDFSSASWCCGAQVEMTSTTLSVANARRAVIRSAGQAAGTIRCQCIDNTATTNLVKDPAEWFVHGFGSQ